MTIVTEDRGIKTFYGQIERGHHRTELDISAYDTHGTHTTHTTHSTDELSCQIFAFYFEPF